MKSDNDLISASLAFFLESRYNNDDLRLLNGELNAADANGESAVLFYPFQERRK